MTEEKPETETPPSVVAPLTMVVLHTLAWVPFLLYMVMVVPSYKKFFADYAVQLPLITVAVLDWADFLGGLGPLWVAGLLVLLVLDWVILQQLRQGGFTRLVWPWFILLALAPLTAWLICGLFLWLPANEVFQALGV